MTLGPTVVQLIVFRFRRLYILFSAYILLLAGLAHLPPNWLSTPVAAILCMPFGFGMLMTVFGFVNVEADLASPASAYSPWLLRLPVKTSTLALWPIVGSAAWASLSWVAFATLYLHPRGIAAPIGWPALMVAALALNLQAIMWAPVRRGGVRLTVAIALPLSIALFGLFASAYGWTEPQIVAVYALVGAVSAVCAWLGLSRARTSPSSGQSTSADASPANEEVLVLNRKRPFRSPQAAQFWLEWRRQGRLLPLLTLFGMIAMSVPLLLSNDNAYIQGSETIKINIWMSTALPVLPWIPLLFATAIGMGARRSDLRGEDGVYHLYHATRPLLAKDLYRAKMLSIAAGVVITAVITIATMLIWLWLPAVSNDHGSVPYARLVFAAFDARTRAIMIGAGFVMIAWAWRNQAVGAFVDYLPSRKLAYAYPFAVVIIGATMYSLAGTNSQHLQEPSCVPELTMILAAILILKIGIAIGCAVKFVSLRPTACREILYAFAGWMVIAGIAATAFGMIVSALPFAAVPTYMQHPIPELLAIVLVPIARPIVARIALELGRHR